MFYKNKYWNEYITYLEMYTLKKGNHCVLLLFCAFLKTIQYRLKPLIFSFFFFSSYLLGAMHYTFYRNTNHNTLQKESAPVLFEMKYEWIPKIWLNTHLCFSLLITRFYNKQALRTFIICSALELYKQIWIWNLCSMSCLKH